MFPIVNKRVTERVQRRLKGICSLQEITSIRVITQFFTFNMNKFHKLYIILIKINCNNFKESHSTLLITLSVVISKLVFLSPGKICQGCTLGIQK